jgi:hypothetical protein
MGGSYFASNTLLSITAAIPPAATLAVFAHLFKKDKQQGDRGRQRGPENRQLIRWHSGGNFRIRSAAGGAKPLKTPACKGDAFPPTAG